MFAVKQAVRELVPHLIFFFKNRNDKVKGWKLLILEAMMARMVALSFTVGLVCFAFPKDSKAFTCVPGWSDVWAVSLDRR